MSAVAEERSGAAQRSIVEQRARAAEHIAAAEEASKRGRFDEAEAHLREAIAHDPNDAMAYAHLGWLRERLSNGAEAVTSYRRALAIDPDLSPARRNLATLLVRLGCTEESFALWSAEAFSGPAGRAWANDVVERVIAAGDLALAGEYAAIVAALHWGSRWYPRGYDGPVFARSRNVPDVFLTLPKLRHDAQQFRFLHARGVLGEEFLLIAEKYERLVERLGQRSEPSGRFQLDDEIHHAIGDVFNRIVNVRHTPRVPRALSDAWSPSAVETQYVRRRPGVVVIDDFLSPDALTAVRAFCLETTVWSANRYAHGRLGAFFRDGFNCPLLLQIAEELKGALPHVVGPYPLRQLWAFKNTEDLPADSTTHADFAAVNVNFWITPTEANLDETSGGMVIHDVDAPQHWDFETYNGRSEVIKPFLRRQQAGSLTIPYRQNRAIIFNSDLFHGTSAVRFRSDYESHRINVTLLYGERANDRHHRQLARPDGFSGGGLNAAWRSSAFRRR